MDWTMGFTGETCWPLDIMVSWSDRPIETQIRKNVTNESVRCCDDEWPWVCMSHPSDQCGPAGSRASPSQLSHQVYWSVLRSWLSAAPNKQTRTPIGRGNYGKSFDWLVVTNTDHNERRMMQSECVEPWNVMTCVRYQLTENNCSGVLAGGVGGVLCCDVGRGVTCRVPSACQGEESEQRNQFTWDRGQRRMAVSAHRAEGGGHILLDPDRADRKVRN